MSVEHAVTVFQQAVVALTGGQSTISSAGTYAPPGARVATEGTRIVISFMPRHLDDRFRLELLVRLLGIGCAMDQEELLVAVGVHGVWLPTGKILDWIGTQRRERNGGVA